MNLSGSRRNVLFAGAIVGFGIGLGIASARFGVTHRGLASAGCGAEIRRQTTPVNQADIDSRPKTAVACVACHEQIRQPIEPSISPRRSSPD